MIERMDGRAQRFEIRLDPAELGRVDIRIEVGADHKVHAVLAAHDSAALSDLMRGQRTLERALQDAGIDLADGGLQFEMSRDTGRSLSGNEQREGSREQTNVWRGFDTVDVGVDADARDLVQATRSYRRAAARLDLVA
jgi:flagellar hook-length control protein FliK